MKLFNVLLILSIVLFFTLKNDDIKLYLVGIVLENNPDLSEFELEARVNKLFEIVKSR